jgi:hypothetical protein
MRRFLVNSQNYGLSGKQADKTGAVLMPFTDFNDLLTFTVSEAGGG